MTIYDISILRRVYCSCSPGPCWFVLDSILLNQHRCLCLRSQMQWTHVAASERSSRGEPGLNSLSGASCLNLSLGGRAWVRDGVIYVCVCVYAFFLNQICFISLRSMYKFNKLGWGVGRHFCAVFAFIQDLRKSSIDLNIVASVKL